MALTTEQARADINAGIQQLVINALVNDLAASRVRVAELEESAKPKSDAPAQP